MYHATLEDELIFIVYLCHLFPVFPPSPFSCIFFISATGFDVCRTCKYPVHPVTCMNPYLRSLARHVVFCTEHAKFKHGILPVWYSEACVGMLLDVFLYQFERKDLNNDHMHYL
jgi:hypothetical protein